MPGRKSAFEFIVGAVLIVMSFMTLYPFLYALAYSFSDGVAVMSRPVLALPVEFTLENYRAVFLNNDIANAALISALRTVFGTAYSVLIVGMAAYSMSKPQLLARRTLNSLFIVTMYVSGGLLPYYMLIHNLQLMNNFLVYIVPGAFYAFFMLLMRVYYENIPGSLEESAKMDGANDWVVFRKIYVPLSLPMFATVALFVSVGQWNAWFDAALFVTRPELYPLQMLLQKVLKESTVTDFQQLLALTGGERKTSVETLRMAILIVTTLPIVFAYPFFQRFFIKSAMLGAVKE